MIAASALLTADEATPQLASACVQRAMARAGLSQAGEVVLFLTPEFARHAAPAVTAASRAAGCLQVMGGIVAGVAGNDGWAMDRPAAAALVIGGLPRMPETDPAATRLSLCGRLHLPPSWGPDSAPPRVGLVYADSLSSSPTPMWQGARIAADDHAELSFAGCDIDIAVSTGVAICPGRLRVDRSAGNEIVHVSVLPTGPSEPAGTALRRVLPVALREQRALPIHLVSISVDDASGTSGDPARLVPLLSSNADGSITLAEALPPGTEFSWAIRLPASAEDDMRRTQDDLVARVRRHAAPPAFGLFLSCIGRGPFFYAGNDRDLEAFRARHPNLPFVGAYGAGQLVPSGRGCALIQNAVATALFTPCAPAERTD